MRETKQKLTKDRIIKLKGYLGYGKREAIETHFGCKYRNVALAVETGRATPSMILLIDKLK